MTKGDFFTQALAAAKASGHIWPDFACCEAAEESRFGNSQLAQEADNLFGQKTPSQPPPGWAYPVVVIPTHEVEHGELVEVSHQSWPKFPDWETSFRERMNLLKRLSAYAPALAATSGVDFINLVSPVWASDPARAGNVLAIYKDNLEFFV
jgi:flagellum-specific peptidoglycan hydrolase FlgJ